MSWETDFQPVNGCDCRGASCTVVHGVMMGARSEKGRLGDFVILRTLWSTPTQTKMSVTPLGGRILGDHLLCSLLLNVVM